MTKNLFVFTLCSHFIQKPFTQSTLFLHVFPIYFNHRQLEIAATQKRLQDFFHNTRADKKLSALLPFNNTFKKTYHPLDGTFFHDVRIHWGMMHQTDPTAGLTGKNPGEACGNGWGTRIWP